jgi:Fur family ferric uptake transcriptional regulator
MSGEIKKRQTAAKKKVLAHLEDSTSAISHDMLELKLKGEMDRVTIYRILKSFEEDGLIHRIIGESGKAYYALCHGCKTHHTHNHLHFQCVKCDSITCLNQEISIPIPEGYEMQNLQLIASGICPTCGVK